MFARAPATNAFSDLYLLQTDGSLRRLTHGGIDSQPVWSPDGRQLAFQRSSKHRHASLYVANADGSGERILPDSVSGPIDWTPDGRRLLYVDDGRIYVTNEDWTERRLLLDPRPQHAADARWSPDGERDLVRARRRPWRRRLGDGRGRQRPAPAHPACARFGLPRLADLVARRRAARVPPPGQPRRRRRRRLRPPCADPLPAGDLPLDAGLVARRRTIAYARLKLGRDRTGAASTSSTRTTATCGG